MSDNPIRVLVVDSDTATRKLLAAALQADRECSVAAVRNAAEALKLLDEKFDLIICDLIMPAASGTDVLVPARARDANVAILILSATMTEESLAYALQNGADDYLQKPVDLRVLRQAIEALLTEQSAPKKDTEVRTLAGGTFVDLMTPSQPAYAERFQRFADRLVSTSLDERNRKNLHLALEEMLQNAMEWGNRNDPTKRLHLSYCILPDRITFRIEDQGEGFDASKLKDPSLDPRAHVALRKNTGKRVGGWGIFMVKKLVDEVRFNRKGNAVFLTKYLKRRGTRLRVTKVLRRPRSGKTRRITLEEQKNG